MEWKDLAPWIAIAVTLILSILVPLFTQIANNSHQRKMQREKFEYEEKQRKAKVFEDFLLNVGATVAYQTKENLPLAGSSIMQIYIYAPTTWWNDLDLLSDCVRNYNWDEAAAIMKKLSKLIAENINKTNIKG